MIPRLLFRFLRRAILAALLALAAALPQAGFRAAAQTTEAAPPAAATDGERPADGGEKSGETRIEQEKPVSDEVRLEPAEEEKTPRQLRQEKRESITGEKAVREKQDRKPEARKKAERKRLDRPSYERRKAR